MALLKDPEFGGAVTTIPYKKSGMAQLDEVDDLALTLGAYNNVYSTPDAGLHGSTTDWRGVLGCLLAGSSQGTGQPSLVLGAGGASRAAVYALVVHLDCPVVYVVNQDDEEVEGLVRDTELIRTAKGSTSRIIDVRTLEEATVLLPPYYIVGTVPDLMPSTAVEHMAIDIFDQFLKSPEHSGVFLNMYFKPIVTRKIKLAKKRGWITVPGTDVIGHQLREQYSLWCDPYHAESIVDYGLEREALAVLRNEAERSPEISFDVDEVPTD